jgi:hypothetical protein
MQLKQKHQPLDEMLAASRREAGWADTHPGDGPSTYLQRPFQLPRRLLPPPPLPHRRLGPGPPWLRRRWPPCVNTQRGSRGVQSRVCSAEQQQLSGESGPRRWALCGQCARRWSCARNSAGGRRNSEKRTPAQHGAAELHLLQEASRQSFGNQASSPFPNKARQHRHGTARRTGLPDGSSAAAAGTRSRCHVVASIRWQVKPAGVASSHCSAFGNSRSRPCLTLPPLSWPVQRRVHNGVPAGLSGRPRRRAGRGQRPCGTAVVCRSACLPSLRSLPVHAERAGPILDSVCPAVGDGEEGSAAPGSGTRAD